MSLIFSSCIEEKKINWSLHAAVNRFSVDEIEVLALG